MIFICGLCSFYCGAVYNEWFGLPLNIFGTCYNLNDPRVLGGSINRYQAAGSNAVKTEATGEAQYYYPRKRTTDDLKSPDVNNTCTYPFGQDSGWAVSKKNKLTYANGIKMKMSVVFGVFHMLLGIFNKG